MVKDTVKLSVSKAVRYNGQPFLYALLNEKPITEKNVNGTMRANLIEEEIPIELLKNALNMDIPSDVIRLRNMLLQSQAIIEQMLRNKQISSLITKKTERDISFLMKKINELKEDK